MREFAAGIKNYDRWDLSTDRTESIEQARLDMTRALIQHSNADTEWDDRRFNNMQLITRSDADPDWLPVDDAAKFALQDVLNTLAREFRQIGSGIVQGIDVYKVYTRLARDLGSTRNPEEFDS